MFSYAGPCGTWHGQHLRECRARAGSQNFKRIRQVAPHCLASSSNTMAANCARGVSDDDMLGAANGWWPAANGIKAGSKVCCLQLPCYTLH